MPTRITVSISSDGQLELWLNPEGRDELVRKLQTLSPSRDHFHLGTWGGDIELSRNPYRKTDSIINTAKVYFRPDEWDIEHFPHVFKDEG